MLVEDIRKNAGLNENKSTKMKSVMVGSGDQGKKIQSFGLVTPENEMGNQLSPEENNKRLKSFKDVLKKGKHQYTKVQGSYGNKEKPFFIYNVNLSTMKRYGQMFNQESFIYGRREDDGFVFEYYEKKLGKNSLYSKIDSTKKMNNESDAKDFFTRHKSFKFNIPFSIFECVEESHNELNETFDYIDDELYNKLVESELEDVKTGKHYWTKRCKLFNRV